MSMHVGEGFMDAKSDLEGDSLHYVDNLGRGIINLLKV